MNKKHCDLCDRVLDNNGTFPVDLGDAEHAVIIAGTPTIDVCLYCLIDAINKKDDRPKQQIRTR
jgi:hypothetical protein